MDLSWLKCTCGAGKMCPMCAVLTAMGLGIVIGLVVAYLMRKTKQK